MSAKPFWTACRGYAGSPACSLLTPDVIEPSATNLTRCCYNGQKPGPLENKILSCVCPVALLSPVGAETINDADGKDSLSRSLAAIGSWSDLDATNVTRKIAE